MKRSILVACVLLACAGPALRAEDGYDLWMRYRTITDAALLARYKAAITGLVLEGDSPTLRAARAELTMGLKGLFGSEVPVDASIARNGELLVGTPASSKAIAGLPFAREL